jgi:hypothetical protein
MQDAIDNTANIVNYLTGASDTICGEEEFVYAVEEVRVQIDAEYSDPAAIAFNANACADLILEGRPHNAKLSDELNRLCGAAHEQWVEMFSD